MRGPSGNSSGLDHGDESGLREFNLDGPTHGGRWVGESDAYQVGRVGPEVTRTLHRCLGGRGLGDVDDMYGRVQVVEGVPVHNQRQSIVRGATQKFPGDSNPQSTTPRGGSNNWMDRLTSEQLVEDGFVQVEDNDLEEECRLLYMLVRRRTWS